MAMFDVAIGATSEASHTRMLGWALRENGTFQDLDRADIDDPPNRIPQPNVDIVHVGTPTTALKTLPLDAGEAPAPGQTVVHDVDELGLPYLPDPMARGLSIVFPRRARIARCRSRSASRGSPQPTEAMAGDRTVPAGAQWQCGAGRHRQGRAVTIALPPGDIQTFRLASSLPKDKLDLMGPWRSLPPAVRDDPDVAEAAADGWLWGLSPFEDVMLVHAVDRPLEAPRPIGLRPVRAEGATHLHLFGAIDLHGPEHRQSERGGEMDGSR